MVQAGLAPPYAQYGQGGGDAAALAQAAAAAAAAAAAGAVPTSGPNNGGGQGIKLEKDDPNCSAGSMAMTMASTSSCTSTATSTQSSVGSCSQQQAAVAAALDSLSAGGAAAAAAAALVGGIDQSSLAVSQPISLFFSIFFFYLRAPVASLRSTGNDTHKGEELDPSIDSNRIDANVGPPPHDSVCLVYFTCFLFYFICVLQAELNAAFGLNLSHQLSAGQQQQQQQDVVNDVNGDPSGVAAAAAAAQAVAAATNTGCSASNSSSCNGATGDLSSGSGSVVAVPGGSTSGAGSVGGSASPKEMPKRLHVSNIPFRFRDPDLRAMFGVM